MSTAPLSTTTTSAAAAASVNNGLATMANNYQTFLSLLTAQLRNQDPLSPMDSTQFTSQLTAMTGVQQQLLTNQLLQQIANNGSASNAMENAANLIGKTVTVDADSATLSNGSASWSFSLPTAPSSLVVNVVDSNNNVVWSGPVNGAGAGAQTFTWNGQNMAGQQLDDGGTYALTIKAVDAAGKTITPVTTYQGSVTAVEQVGGQTMATVNGAQTPLSSIIGVSG
jgi:flagellar basal-body rod modification protein FlgD